MARVRGRKRRDLKSEINIVPLLDVLLVLLLIFMATAPIITQSVDVDLPDATDSKTVSSDDNPPVIVEVAGVGQYSLVVDHAEGVRCGGREWMRGSRSRREVRWAGVNGGITLRA